MSSKNRAVYPLMLLISLFLLATQAIAAKKQRIVRDSVEQGMHIIEVAGEPYFNKEVTFYVVGRDFEHTVHGTFYF